MSSTASFTAAKVLSKSKYDALGSKPDTTLHFVEMPVVVEQTTGTDATVGTYRYRKWSDGTLEQWISYPSTTAESATVTYPRPYLNGNVFITSTDGGLGSSGSDTAGYDMVVGVTNITATTFRISKVKSRELTFYCCGEGAT